MGLNKANLSRTKRYARADDEDWIKGNEDEGIEAHPSDDYEVDDAWIELRTSLTGREDDRISDIVRAERVVGDDGRITLRSAKLETANPAVFEILAVAWSLAEGKPKREDYEELEIPDRAWINRCVNRAVGIARGESEGNESSPRKAASPSSSPDSSPAVEEQTPAT